MSDPGRPGAGLLAWLDGPPGAPVLVLGNSLGTSREVWEPQVPVLRRHFRLLRYELPGHGSAAGGWSPGPPGPYTVSGLGRQVLALLDARGLDRVLYAGISLGGMIGMWLAANAPERVAGLGLCCTSAYLPPASGWADRAALVRASGLAPVIEASLQRWFPGRWLDRNPAQAQRFSAMLAGIEPEGYAGCCEAIGSMDLRGSLAAIAAPTLVIAGAGDPATPPSHGAAIAAGIPGAALRVVSGASHLASVSAAAEVTARLLAHLGPRT
ncbi:MAG TPA: alpha/beta fold hydrolase [Streptosporangiaceae bacterium]|jgi:3-oxoadipate enol-lactonase